MKRTEMKRQNIHNVASGKMLNDQMQTTINGTSEDLDFL